MVAFLLTRLESAGKLVETFTSESTEQHILYNTKKSIVVNYTFHKTDSARRGDEGMFSCTNAEPIKNLDCQITFWECYKSLLLTIKEMKGPPKRRLSRFLHSLAVCWMRMYSICNILKVCAHFDCQCRLGYHRACLV